MTDFIPLAEPFFDEEDARAVYQALKSGRVKQGPQVRSFEDTLAKCVGVKHAVMVSSGTAALHLAYIACGIKANDEIIMPSLTYIATASAALYINAKPVFVDVDPLTYNINPDLILKKLGKKPKQS